MIHVTVELVENTMCPESFKRCQNTGLNQLCCHFCFYKVIPLNFFFLISSVPPGLEGMKEQDLCNKIMAKILENYNTLFEVDYKENDNQGCESLVRIIIVKVSNVGI